MEREPATLDEALSLACRLEAYDMCTGNIQSNIKTDAEFAGLKPKYVKATSGDTRLPAPPNDVEYSLESKLCKQLDAMQSVLDRCQTAIQSQNVQLAAQGNEILRLSNSISEDKSRQSGVNYPMSATQTGAAVGSYSSKNAPAQPSVYTPANSNLSAPKSRNSKAGVCYSCGQSGHFARDHRLPNFNADVNAVTNQSRGINVTDSNADVYMKARLNGKQMSVLLDTGSEKKICGSHLLQGIQYKPTSERLLAANGTPIVLLGAADIIICVNGKEIRLNVVVSDAVDELIGASFLSQHQCVWDFSRGVINFDGQSIKLHSQPPQLKSSRRRIFCAHEVSIPGHHAMDVPVNIARPTLKQNAEGWAVELSKLPGSLAASRVLVRDEAVQVSIKLINLSDQTLTIRRDSLLGTAEPVQVLSELDSVTEKGGARDVTSDVRARVNHSAAFFF